MSELDAIKNKAIAFLAMTDARSGASETEAMFAAKKLGELMEQYNLSLDDLTIRDEKVKRVRVSSGIKIKSRPHSILAYAVARFCDCSYFFESAHGNVIAQGGRRKGQVRYGITDIVWNFVGVGQDADMAEYLFKTLLAALRNDTNKFSREQERKEHGTNRVARSSFEDGFVLRVFDRLDELRKEREAHMAKYSTSTALITTKGEMVKSYMAEEIGRLIYKHSKTTRGTNFDRQAWSAGVNSANTANIERPVGSEGRNQLLLR